MVVSLTIIFVGLLAGIPIIRGKKQISGIYFGILVLCSLYLFFNPPVSYDLYRHYTLLQESKNYSLFEMINNGISAEGIAYKNYPVYMLILKFFSFLPSTFLPMVVGYVTYAVPYSCVEDVFKKNNIYWIRVACFAYLICSVDFRNISGIRNNLAFTLFFWALYRELVKKKNKYFMWAVYISTCFIHSACFLLLAIRIILEVYKKIGKTIIRILILSSMFFLPRVIDVMRYLFRNVPSLQYALEKFEIYNQYESINVVIIVIRSLTYFCILLLAIYFKKYCKRFLEFREIYDYAILLLLFSFSSINIYSLFSRMQIILLPFGVFFLACILDDLAMPNVLCLKAINKGNKLQIGVSVLLICFFGVAINFLALIKGSYTGMNAFFIF